MSLGYIQKSYNVPATEGQRIRFDYDGREGVIVGANGPHLVVEWDEGGVLGILHPTWKVTYLGEEADHA